MHTVLAFGNILCMETFLLSYMYRKILKIWGFEQCQLQIVSQAAFHIKLCVDVLEPMFKCIKPLETEYCCLHVLYYKDFVSYVLFSCAPLDMIDWNFWYLNSGKSWLIPSKNHNLIHWFTDTKTLYVPPNFIALYTDLLFPLKFDWLRCRFWYP